jgi:hypothetical protein
MQLKLMVQSQRGRRADACSANSLKSDVHIGARTP